MLSYLRDATLDKIRKSSADLVERIKSYDLHELEREVTSSITDTMSKLAKHIKNLTDKFVVDVNYDRDTHVVSYKIENSTLTVTTTLDSDDSRIRHASTTTRITLPNNVIVESLKTRYNDEEKKMYFIFMKDATENDTPTERTEDSAISVETPVSAPFCQTEEPIIELEVETEEETETNEADLNLLAEKTQLQKRMVELFESGMSFRKIAAIVGLSDKTVAKWIRDYQIQ